MYRHDRRTIEARELRNLVFQGGDRERALPAVEVALDVELEHHPRMIAGPADIKRLNVDEAKLIEVERADERVDSSHRIVLSHVFVKRRREQQGGAFLNRTCAVHPHFESMLLPESPKIFFRQHRQKMAVAAVQPARLQYPR
jgi:hypothetical protein